MDDFQLIFPGQLPLIQGFIIIALLIIAITGLLFTSKGIKLLNQNSKKTILKYGSLALGIIFLFFPIFNLINYHIIHYSFEKKYFGTYINNERGLFIEFQKNGNWFTNFKNIDCKKGIWEYVITEDINYLELKGKCDNHITLQITSANSDTLEIKETGKFEKKKSYIQFTKIKN